MAWDEWEQLKMAAAERQSGAAHMQLNQREHTGDGGNITSAQAELVHNKQAWKHAAGVAHDLFTGTRSAKGKLTSAHDGVATGAKGLQSAVTLAAVLTSWENRLAKVHDECNSLDPALRQVAHDLGNVDHTVAAKTSSVRTPAVRQEG